MDTARVYYNLMGEPRTIWQMLREEPEWSANRIQAAEDALARAEAAERDNARLREVVLRHGLHRNAPCCLCGHSGPGMYRPETHPCIAEADALLAEPGEPAGRE